MEDLLQGSVPTANSIKGHSTLSFDQNIYKVIDFDVGSEQEVYYYLHRRLGFLLYRHSFYFADRLVFFF